MLHRPAFVEALAASVAAARLPADAVLAVFLDIGMDTRLEGFEAPLADAVAEALRRGGVGAPAVTHTRFIAGSEASAHVVACDAASESRCRFAVLNPSDAVVDWVARSVRDGPAPSGPLVIGLGAGGSAERAMELARRALLQPQDRSQPAHDDAHQALCTAIAERLAAEGLDVTDVRLGTAPTHAANLPLALLAVRDLVVWSVPLGPTS